MNSSSPRAVRLYEITYLGVGHEPEIRTVEPGEVAAAIKYAGERGMRVLIRPWRGPVA